MLAVRGLEVAYGESLVLAGVDLRVGAGEVVCVMGRNGVGKTTLLRAVMGLLPPRRGAVEVRGEPVTHLPPWARAARGLGYVPQGREIFPALTVRENLALGARRKEPPRERLDYVLSLFPALATLLGRRGGDLSGGQQQQLAIARALVAGPSLLLLDEPTEGIQPSIVEEIADVLVRLKAEGRCSVLVVEQYLEFAWSIGDRFYVMDRGGVAREGDRAALRPEELAEHLAV
jgi:urea transport system ATP-binding protein